MSDKNNALKLVKIVPPEGSGVRLSRGTKVLTPDGSAIPGITNLTIHVRPDDVWRATIDVMVEPMKLSDEVAQPEDVSVEWPTNVDVAKCIKTLFADSIARQESMKRIQKAISLAKLAESVLRINEATTGEAAEVVDAVLALEPILSRDAKHRWPEGTKAA